jgi:exosortase A-associated hydrolase 2
VVYVHPFAEEMNKSRRMVALQARALAANGYAVLQMDLLGCGDSAGDFGDATWAAWVNDVIDAAQLAQQRFRQTWPRAGTPTLWLWGLRAGCLLATEAAARLDVPLNLLLWQPTLHGKAVLQQFLRLDTVSAWLEKDGSQRNESANDILNAGRKARVAGYLLEPAMAQGLKLAQLRPAPLVRRSVWLSIGPQAELQPPPATLKALAAWSQQALQPHYQAVSGPAFWQTTEIEDAPALIEATLQALQAGVGDSGTPMMPVEPATAGDLA